MPTARIPPKSSKYPYYWPGMRKQSRENERTFFIIFALRRYYLFLEGEGGKDLDRL